MIFEYGSDLHLEFNLERVAMLTPRAETLVLAGDVVEIDKLIFHRHIQDWFRLISEQYKQVIWVFGNHEHYHGCYSDNFIIARRWLEENHLGNIKILENETLEIDGVLFYGATLWTDADKGNPLSAQLIQRGMNDYNVITIRDVALRRLTVDDTVRFHKESLGPLKDFADLKTDLVKILVTHHLISSFLIDPEFRDSRYNGAYASDLNWLLESDIAVAINGHSHRRHQTKIADNFLAVANPRGYFGHEAIADDFKFELIEVNDVEK